MQAHHKCSKNCTQLFRQSIEQQEVLATRCILPYYGYHVCIDAHGWLLLLRIITQLFPTDGYMQQLRSNKARENGYGPQYNNIMG